MLKINPQKETKKIINFFKKTLKKTGLNRLIIPLSGGVDSSTTAYLAAKALPPKDILIIHLPYQGITKDTDYQLIAKNLKIPKKNIFIINIKPVVDLLWQKTNHPLTPSRYPLKQIRLGNIMARVRMIILYDLAKANKALVAGAENKSEHLLGYYTLHGDNASDLEPTIHLYKTQTIQLAKYLGVPQKIIAKPPSAGLWKNQTDEKELGFSYSQADPILYFYFDKKYEPKKIIQIGYSKTLVDRVITQARCTAFKKTLPYKI